MDITSGEGKGARERNKRRFVCQSVPRPLHLLSLVKEGKRKGSAFCKSSDEMLTKQAILCNFPAAVSQQLTHSELLHFKQRRIVTSDMHLIRGFSGRPEKTVTVVPFRSGGCRLRRQPHKGALCLSNSLSGAPVKG